MTMKILVIRRDNIGDLVCTTPLLAALRQHHAQAWIGVLANAYNAEVLYANPHVDEVLVYRKAKHRRAGESRWGIWLETARLMLHLRLRGIDLAIVASPGGERYARMVGARRIVSGKPSQPPHEVERCCALLMQLGLEVKPGPLVVRPRPQLVRRMSRELGMAGAGVGAVPTLGVHVSSRKESQRWPAGRFAELIRRVLDSGLFERVLLFWSPGAENDPLHPGDDEKVGAILESCAGLPVFPVVTRELAELVAGLSLVDQMFCSDGGAMHIAAGLGKPVVSMFGDSPPAQWHPWGVSHTVLQVLVRRVDAIPVEAALEAIIRLRRMSNQDVSQ